MAHHSKSTMPFNYFPRHRDRKSAKIPIECKLSNGTPCPPCLLQSKLKAQIEETKRLLDKLIAEEQQAWNQINHYHDPLHRIPPEITSHIFLFTLPDFELHEVTWPNERPHVQRPRSEPGVLSLGAVCQLWRNIAWSTARLWCKVMLTLTEEPTDNMIEVVEQWLERSRELPLSIRLHLGYLIYQSAVKDQTVSFVNSFNDHSTRWEHLSIQSSDELFTHFAGNPSGSHYLKTLQLIQDSDGSIWPEFRLSGRIPQPENIIAMGFLKLDNVHVSWNNATTVMVEWITPLECINLLRIAPKLTSLRLQDINGGRRSRHRLTDKTLTFPHLKTFCISESAPSVSVGAILDSIALPSLEKLSIRGNYMCHYGGDVGPIRFPFSKVMGFLQRSSCSLTTFTLDYSECEEEEILNTLYSLPSIKNLQLDIRIPDAERKDLNLLVLFDHLSRALSATDGILWQAGLLPNLETFKYHVFKGTQIPWNLLSSIARPVFGEKRLFNALTIIERQPYCENPPLIITKEQNIDKNVIRDLISLQEENIDLYFPSKVSRETLLALLEDE